MAKEKKGKKPHRNKATSKKYTKFKIEGDKITRGKTCPRCGPGVFLMIASNRKYCGRCRYTEFSKKEEKVTEASVEAK